jgi:hypothetical protein
MTGIPGKAEVAAVPHCSTSRHMRSIWVVPPETGQSRWSIDFADRR